MSPFEMASIYEKYNCSSPKSHQPDEEYSDISGIGVSSTVISSFQVPLAANEDKVVIAFNTVAYMMILLSFLDYYLYFGVVPSPGVHQQPAKLRNQIDRAVVIPFQRALRFAFPSVLEERRVKETHDVLHAVSELDCCDHNWSNTIGIVHHHLFRSTNLHRHCHID